MDVEFVRVHRNGPNPLNNGKPRSITARLVYRSKKDEILHAQKQMKQQNVQLPFYITPQSPMPTVENRREIMEILKCSI